MALIQQAKINLLQVHSFKLILFHASTLNRTGRNKVMASAN